MDVSVSARERQITIMILLVSLLTNEQPLKMNHVIFDTIASVGVTS